METFVETIRRVGIFMIVAQVVIHLAPGKQYEKYIKLIAGVIVLVQLISPFYQISEESWDKWIVADEWNPAVGQKNLDAILSDREASQYQSVLQEIQDKIKSRLNNPAICEGYYVKSVEIVLDRGQSGREALTVDADTQGSWQLRKLIVIMQEEKKGEDGSVTDTQDAVEWSDKESRIEPVQIETVTLDNEQVKQEERTTNISGQQRQEMAAQISARLGVEEACVEVRIDGDR